MVLPYINMHPMFIAEPFLNNLRKISRGTQVKRDELAITVKRTGTLSGIALRYLCCRQLRIQSARERDCSLHWRRDCPQKCRFQVSDSQDKSGLKVPGGPWISSRPTYTQNTPGISNRVGPICWFPFRHWGNLLWRRQWHPTPVLLPGKSHERRSLVGCSPWGR